MKRALVCCIAALASACTTNQITYVSSDFSEQEEQDIQRGADLWDDATSGAVHFDLVFNERIPAGSRRVVLRETLDRKYCRLVGSGRALGCTDRSGFLDNIIEGERSRIFLIPDIEQDLVKTVAHELGHSLGMDHVNNSQSIMYKEATPGAPTCITWADIEEACKQTDVDCTDRVRKPCD